MRPARLVTAGLLLLWAGTGGCCCIVFPVDLWTPNLAEAATGGR